MTKHNIWVSPAEEGWKAKREGATRASGVFETQKEAEDYGRKIMQNGSGGELITQNKHGVIRSKDTINSEDNNPPKDTEN